MKEPKLKSLKFDRKETGRVQRAINRKKSIKITINVDADSLAAVKQEAAVSGVPYQRLLNNLLKQSLSEKRAAESRLDRLERELKEVKKKLAA